MPRENKKRGRRALEKKRKHDDEEPDEEPDTKRVKSLSDQEAVPFSGPSSAVVEDGLYESNVATFYGNLTESEQAYFKHADDMLELNQFADAEERDVFLTNVYREADGKELIIASSQSCSRLLEKLILVSSPEQLKTLFQTLSGE